MQIKSAEFSTSARNLEECPEWQHPEFAFIGRSNVGKSSLINLLVNRHSLAKVSATPGKTRLLNFYLVNGKWSLVDLPGYGYAKAARSEKFDFNERAGDYLEGRPNLRRVFTLIDSRLAPQRIDLDFIAWLGSTGTPFSLIFTKTDKQSAGKTQAAIAMFLEAVAPFASAKAQVLTSSAKTRNGRLEILRTIAQELA
jgi:GTP-binding protein